jgi:DNA-binding CsgD family transcriptional regulator
MTDMRDVTWRFINMAPIASSQGALDDLFAETLEPFGIERFDCVRLIGSEDSPAGVLAGRGMGEWVRHFLEADFQSIDPCIPTYMRLRGAFTWSQAKEMNPELADTAMWSDARADGLVDGLIVPTAPGRRTAAIVRLVLPEVGVDPAVLPLLQSMSTVYATGTQSFSATIRPDIPSPVPLRERELECLHWAARGKTNSEIATIVGISRHTVNSHIESAKVKLGVATRMQAAAFALRLGLLSIA